MVPDLSIRNPVKLSIFIDNKKTRRAIAIDLDTGTQMAVSSYEHM